MEECYNDLVDPVPPSARFTLNWITAERVDLYHQVQPPGDNIHVYAKLFQVEDLVPKEDEIYWALRRLQNNQSGGPSRMRADQLKEWL